MKRRKFLVIAGVGSAIAAFVSVRFLTSSFEHAAESLISDELGFLKLEHNGLKQFVREFAATKGAYYKFSVKGYWRLGVSASQSGKIHQLVSSYILSTDFFNNKMDESKQINYVGLYNPYTKPCAHPFSHLQYPAKNPVHGV